MKNSTVLATMLAGAAACALSTTPALADQAPNIHWSMYNAPIRLNSGVNHFKTTHNAHTGKLFTTFTSTFSNVVASNIAATDVAFQPITGSYWTWYAKSSSGACKSTKDVDLVKTKSGNVNGIAHWKNVTAPWPAGYGCVGGDANMHYHGIQYKITNLAAHADTVDVTLKTLPGGWAPFTSPPNVYNLTLFERVNLTW
jgi:hypothetical protein